MDGCYMLPAAWVSKSALLRVRFNRGRMPCQCAISSTAPFVLRSQTDLSSNPGVSTVTRSLRQALIKKKKNSGLVCFECVLESLRASITRAA